MQYSFSKFFSMQCSSVVFSSNVGKEKKSLEPVLWMAVCGCGSPARCCHPAVAGGVIYAALRGELYTHLALQAMFTQNSPVCEPLLQAFPFPSTVGEVTPHLLCQACLFVYSSQWKWFFPHSPVEFSSHRHSHKLSCSWLLGACCYSRRSLSSHAWLVYLQFQEGFPSPLFGAQGAPLSLLCVFVVLIAYYSVSLFSLGGGQSVQGAMLIWPRVVCESTMYHFAHLVCIFPSRLGEGIWQWPGGPPGFSL
jgi:hypothetical protein